VPAFLAFVKSFDNFDSFFSCTSRHEAEAFSFSLMIEEALSVEVSCVDMDALASAAFLDDLRSLCGGGPMSQCDDMVEVSGVDV
jgi:hypothetical protein